MRTKATTTLMLMLFILSVIPLFIIVDVEASKEDVIILSDSYYETKVVSHIVGEVQNQGTSNLEFVRITATFYDSSNNVIATDFTYTDIDTLLPQQKSPFDVSSFPSHNLALDHYSVVVSSCNETSKIPYRDLRIQGVTTATEQGYYHIRGEVENIGQTDTTFTKLIVTYYDSSGNVIGTKSTYTDPSNITAGSKATFDCSSYPREITPDSYLLQVECNEYLTTSTISCAVSSASLNIGSSAIISGTISPARSGATVILSNKSNGSWSTLATVASASDGSYSYSWTPALVGNYQFKASWEGDSSFAGATSNEVSATVSKISTTIYCSVSHSDLTIGNSTLIWGSINPTFLEIVNITLSIKPDEGLWSDLTTVKNDFHYAYYYSWTPEYADSYEIKATWDGYGLYEGSTSDTTLVQVNKISANIACSVSSTEITGGESVIITGVIDPPLSDKTIILTYTKPEGSLFTRTVTTGSDGSFSDSFPPDADGSWSAVALWDGDSMYKDASSSEVHFTMNTSLIGGPGWVEEIVLVGGIGIALVSVFIFLRVKSSKHSIWR